MPPGPQRAGQLPWSGLRGGALGSRPMQLQVVVGVAVLVLWVGFYGRPFCSLLLLWTPVTSANGGSSGVFAKPEGLQRAGERATVVAVPTAGPTGPEAGGC